MKEQVKQAHTDFLNSVMLEHGVGARNFCEEIIPVFAALKSILVIAPVPATFFSEHVLHMLVHQNARYTRLLIKLYGVSEELSFLLLDKTNAFVDEVAATGVSVARPQEEQPTVKEEKDLQVQTMSVGEFTEFLQRFIGGGKKDASTPAA